MIGLERRQLLIAAEDVCWLGVPMSTIDDNVGGTEVARESISVYPVIPKIQSGSNGPVGKELIFFQYF